MDVTTVIILQTRALLSAQARLLFLPFSPIHTGASVPGFIEVYSVGSSSATKYRGAPDREAITLVHPQEQRPDVKVETSPTMH